MSIVSVNKWQTIALNCCLTNWVLPLRTCFKMTASLRISLVWLWMSALLIASVGVSIQQVYCYCLGETTVTFFVASDACQTSNIDISQTQDSGCCKKNTPAKKSCCEKSRSDKKDCTKKTTRVFQLKTKFEVVNSDFKKFDIPKNWAFNHYFPGFPQTSLGVQKVNFPDFERPPPSISGRMICVRHGVFRC